jgi:DNA-binding transcriptional MocR family regulator
MNFHPQLLLRESESQGDQTLVERIVAWYAQRIDDRLLRPGSKVASIRQFASEQEVSRFTVVEAYDRLIARGYLESRRGSGFYVRERSLQAGLAVARSWAEVPQGRVDVVWLLRNMFKRLPAQDMPGGGVLPAEMLDEALVTSSLRTLSRQSGAGLLDYGHPQGYLPLRQQLQMKLAEVEIQASPDQIVMTNGVSQALDLIAQHFIRPGDTVLVDEPSWFLLFGRLSLLGARILGVPRLADGPDLTVLEALAREHQPKLFFTTAVLHNPTSSSMSAAKAFQVLRLAETLGFKVVEDDIYSDLHPGASFQNCTRLAALDQLKNIIYLSGFSKTLAANLRVGFLVASPDLARELTDLKMLVGLTSSELGERVVYRILSEGHYRRHLVRLRQQLSLARGPVLRELEKLGLEVFASPQVGMFLWTQARYGTNALAQAMLDKGFLLAPGSLFLPDQRDSQWLRFNVATSHNPKMWAELAQLLKTPKLTPNISRSSALSAR